ncbi:MAG: flagellar protein FlaG [Synergistaceae bacterium]|nr:flagellar protein FlaG [Synergistaceae bacterium]
MKLDYTPPAFTQSAAAEHQRQVIKTRILGNAGAELPEHRQNNNEKKISDDKSRQTRQQTKLEQLADKAKSEVLDKASEMRYLKYDIIDDADIVQVSVINSSDGTIIRKFPPDKVVSLVRKIREKFLNKSGLNLLDMKL